MGEDRFGSTRPHLEMLVRKRDSIRDSIGDSLEQVCAHIARESWTPSEAVEWWEWGRGLEIPCASRDIARALGTSVTQITRWKQYPPPDHIELTGGFPIEFQPLPPKGSPCVYLLVNGFRDVVYVGSSEHVRARLRVTGATSETSSTPGKLSPAPRARRCVASRPT